MTCVAKTETAVITMATGNRLRPIAERRNLAADAAVPTASKATALAALIKAIRARDHFTAPPALLMTASPRAAVARIATLARRRAGVGLVGDVLVMSVSFLIAGR